MTYREMAARAHFEQYSWVRPMLAQANARNIILLTNRQRALSARTDMGTGDFVRVGTELKRIAHVWDDVVQLTRGGSFYLNKSGGCSYSGSLESGIPKKRFHSTDETLSGSCWFFSDDYATAHNGYDCEAMFRVWRCDA